MNKLPAAPEGRAGWPWTETSDPLPPAMPDGSPWPRITIVTPSYNQGEFLEETIRSILLQGYPNLEYIIIDGGSSDNSIEVIRKYEPWVTFWVSEKDQGQADAIQKGIEHSSGEIFNWINSDDLLTPNALKQIALSIGNNDFLYSNVFNFSDNGESELYCNQNLTYENILLWLNEVRYHQPGCWIKRELLEQIGGLRTDLHYVFDYEMMLRYLKRARSVSRLNEPTAMFRLHGGSKTVSQSRKFDDEMRRVLLQHKQSIDDVELRRKLAASLSERQIRDEWFQKIEQISNSPISRPHKLLSLALGITQSPARRFNRFSLGALRRIASGQ
jgi:glycosyltransferase involved in cell wall biosynthesis